MSYQEDFISAVLPEAAETQVLCGLPGAVMVAQCCQETGYGQYVTCDMNTGQNSMNLFNIKGTGPAGSVLAPTTEYINGKYVKENDYFRAYHNYQESFADYVSFIASNSRYGPAIAVASDPVQYARQLQACGYATDPNYANSLINLMNQYNLVSQANQIAYPQIQVKGQTLSGALISGSTYAPVRKIGELLGYQVNWDAATGIVTVGGIRIQCLGVYGVSYAPVRYLAESLGHQVAWDQVNHIAVIS